MTRLSCSRFVLLIFVTLVSIDLSSYGNIQLTAGDLAVELSSSASWTVNKMTKGQHAIVDCAGSAQGSVLLIDGQWAGSKHGREKVTSFDIFIDGAKQSVVDGSSYSGNNIKIVKTSILGDAYILNSTMDITGEYSHETVSFKYLDASKQCTVFYAFLGSRANRLTDVASFDNQGSLLFLGQSNIDTGTYVNLEKSNAVAQYDPLSKDGVLTVVYGADSANIKPFIWDRSADNKLYFKMLNEQNQPRLGEYFEFGQRISFFQADSGEWLKTVSSMTAVPEPSIMLLLCSGLVFLRKR